MTGAISNRVMAQAVGQNSSGDYIRCAAGIGLDPAETFAYSVGIGTERWVNPGTGFLTVTGAPLSPAAIHRESDSS